MDAKQPIKDRFCATICVMLSSFETSWQALSSELRSFLRKRLPSLQDADDLLQEIAAVAYGKRKQLEDPVRFRAWVYRITRNRVIDFYRTDPHRLEHLEPHEMEGFSAEDPDDNPQKDSTAASCVRAILQWLPDKYRQTLVLADIEGKTFVEISKQLDISVSGAKSRAQRARKMLRDGLEECCNLEFDAYGNVASSELKPHDCQYCRKDHSDRCH